MHQNQVLFNVAALAVLAFPLSGCGGGGGSNSNPAPAVVTTTPPPANITQTLQLNGGSSSGLSVSTDYVYDNETRITVLGSPTAASSTTLNVTPSGTITSVTLSAPNATRFGNTSTWTAPGDEIDITPTNGLNACEGGCPSLRELNLFTANGTAPNYQYLSYGVWSDLAGTTGTVRGVAGFLTVGQPTAPANIPATGSATYSGSVNGLFNDSVSSLTAGISADFSAVANFSTRTLGVSTNGTEITTSTGTFAAPEHNASGTLSYAAGSNQFSGIVSTASGMTGTATGQFFGPTAQEMGGVYDIAGGGKRSLGTFVGKQ